MLIKDLCYVIQLLPSNELIIVSCQPHRWCNGKRARLECSKSWVRDPIVSNQRLWIWDLSLLC